MLPLAKVCCFVGMWWTWYLRRRGEHKLWTFRLGEASREKNLCIRDIALFDSGQGRCWEEIILQSITLENRIYIVKICDAIKRFDRAYQELSELFLGPDQVYEFWFWMTLCDPVLARWPCWFAASLLWDSGSGNIKRFNDSNIKRSEHYWVDSVKQEHRNSRH